MSDDKDSETTATDNASGKVLRAFLNELESQGEHEQVVVRLSGVVFDDSVSESTLRTALFGDE